MEKALDRYRKPPRPGAPRCGVLDCRSRLLFVVQYKCGISSFHQYALNTSDVYAVDPRDGRLVRAAVNDGYRLVFVWRDPARRFASWYYNWLRRSFIDGGRDDEVQRYAAHGSRLLNRQPAVYKAVHHALCDDNNDVAALEALLPSLFRLMHSDVHLRPQYTLFAKVLLNADRQAPDVVLQTDVHLADDFARLTDGRTLPHANRQTPDNGYERLFGDDERGRAALQHVRSAYAADYACVEQTFWTRNGSSRRRPHPPFRRPRRRREGRQAQDVRGRCKRTT